MNDSKLHVITKLYYISTVVPFTIRGDTLSFREGCVVGPTAPTPAVSDRRRAF